jgi:hypothetical protein
MVFTRSLARRLVLGMTPVLLGCGELTFFCLRAGAPGLLVQVQTTSGTPLVGARGEVRDGSFVAELNTDPSSSQLSTLSVALERSGAYDVSVWKDGYARWGATGVVIAGNGGGGCGVPPVRLVATLQPVGP